MCDICVMNSVKDRMLSRRSFFKVSGAGAVATVAGTAIGTPAMAAGHSTVKDMTHTLHEDFPTYFGESQFFREQSSTSRNMHSTCSSSP
jgi:anaerobic selenocysteine-containing dehydrogenase